MLKMQKLYLQKASGENLSIFAQNAWKNRDFYSCKVINISSTFY